MQSTRPDWRPTRSALAHPVRSPLLVLIGLALAYRMTVGPVAWARWPLLLSGVLALVVLLEVIPIVARRADRAVVLVWARHLSGDRLAQWLTRRTSRERRLGWVGAAMLALATGFILRDSPSTSAWPVVCAGAAAALLAGNRVGRLAAAGPLGWLLEARAPENLRRNGRGAMLIGESFGLTALPVALPVVYFGSWAVLIHAGGAPVLAPLAAPMLGLFAASLAIELVCFVFPLLVYATAMWRRAPR